MSNAQYTGHDGEAADISKMKYPCLNMRNLLHNALRHDRLDFHVFLFSQGEHMVVRSSKHQYKINNKSVIFTLLFLVAIFLFISSCGKKNSPPNSKSNNKSHELPEIKHNTSDFDILEQTQRVVRGINDRVIEREEGLKKIQIAFNTFSKVNDIRIKTKNASSQTIKGQYQNLGNILELLSTLTDSGPINNLALILKAETFIEQGGIDFKDKIEDLFIALKARQMHFNLTEDLFLIQFLTNQEMAYTSTGVQSLITDEIVAYFKERLTFQIELADSKKARGKVIAYYSTLYKTISDGKKVFKIFEEPLKKVVIGNKSPLALINLYIDFMDYLAQNSTNNDLEYVLNHNHINSVAFLAKNAINKFEKDSSEDNLVQMIRALDRLVQFMIVPKDNFSDGYALITYLDWQSKVNGLYDLMNRFKSSLVKLTDNSARLQQLASNGMRYHPYIQLYIDRALFLRTSSPSRIEVRSRGYEGTLEGLAYNTGSDQHLSDVNKRYVEIFMALDYYKFQFLKLSFVQGQKQQSAPNDKRQKVYQEVVTNLIAALDLHFFQRFNHNFDLYKQGNKYKTLAGKIDIVNSSSGSWYKVDLGHPVNETENQAADVLPGIYRINNYDVKVVGDQINFHPLSMILVPGKKFMLKSKQVSNLWIDTSAESPIQTAPNGFMVFLNMIRPSQGKIGNKYFIDYNGSESFYKTVYKQATGADGINGGDIIIKTDKISLDSLFISNGSSGLTGHVVSDHVNAHSSWDQYPWASNTTFDVGLYETQTTRGRCIQWGTP
ncbi:MAG: hypothetical protein ISR65_19920 [Bacteriovoracaceae bacterium]|nr:hypothetical protein [Bacteriovoracaceae bacterium]